MELLFPRPIASRSRFLHRSWTEPAEEPSHSDASNLHKGCNLGCPSPTIVGFHCISARIDKSDPLKLRLTELCSSDIDGHSFSVTVTLPQVFHFISIDISVVPANVISVPDSCTISLLSLSGAMFFVRIPHNEIHGCRLEGVSEECIKSSQGIRDHLLNPIYFPSTATITSWSTAFSKAYIGFSTGQIQCFTVKTSPQGAYAKFEMELDTRPLVSTTTALWNFVSRRQSSPATVVSLHHCVLSNGEQETAILFAGCSNGGLIAWDLASKNLLLSTTASNSGTLQQIASWHFRQTSDEDHQIDVVALSQSDGAWTLCHLSLEVNRSPGSTLPLIRSSPKIALQVQKGNRVVQNSGEVVDVFLGVETVWILLRNAERGSSLYRLSAHYAGLSGNGMKLVQRGQPTETASEIGYAEAFMEPQLSSGAVVVLYSSTAASTAREMNQSEAILMTISAHQTDLMPHAVFLTGCPGGFNDILYSSMGVLRQMVNLESMAAISRSVRLPLSRQHRSLDAALEAAMDACLSTRAGTQATAFPCNASTLSLSLFSCLQQLARSAGDSWQNAVENLSEETASFWHLKEEITPHHVPNTALLMRPHMRGLTRASVLSILESNLTLGLHFALLVHFLDKMHSWLGMPDSVAATLRSLVMPTVKLGIRETSVALWLFETPCASPGASGTIMSALLPAFDSHPTESPADPHSVLTSSQNLISQLPFGGVEFLEFADTVCQKLQSSAEFKNLQTFLDALDELFPAPLQQNGLEMGRESVGGGWLAYRLLLPLDCSLTSQETDERNGARSDSVSALFAAISAMSDEGQKLLALQKLVNSAAEKGDLKFILGKDFVYGSQLAPSVESFLAARQADAPDGDGIFSARFGYHFERQNWGNAAMVAYRWSMAYYELWRGRQVTLAAVEPLQKQILYLSLASSTVRLLPTNQQWISLADSLKGGEQNRIVTLADLERERAILSTWRTLLQSNQGTDSLLPDSYSDLVQLETILPHLVEGRLFESAILLTTQILKGTLLWLGMESLYEKWVDFLCSQQAEAMDSDDSADDMASLRRSLVKVNNGRHHLLLCRVVAQAFLSHGSQPDIPQWLSDMMEPGDLISLYVSNGRLSEARDVALEYLRGPEEAGSQWTQFPSTAILILHSKLSNSSQQCPELLELLSHRIKT